jgi:hypothetical protein
MSLQTLNLIAICLRDLTSNGAKKRKPTILLKKLSYTDGIVYLTTIFVDSDCNMVLMVQDYKWATV